jgi:integrase
MGLGSLEEVGLAEAREKAAEARRLVRAGRDPIENRNSERAAKYLVAARGTTFRRAAEEYIATHQGGWRSETHRQQWKRTLEAYAFPVLGELQVADITTQHVHQVLEAIWFVKPQTGSRVRARIETVINAARADDDSKWSNPARWERHKHKFPKCSKVAPVRHHPYLPYKEIPGLIADLRGRDGVTMRALEFAVLTACRSGEVRGARWAEIDFDNRLWEIPGLRMKGGKPHTVVLSRRAVAILREMATIRMSELVFPGMQPSKQLHMRTLLLALSELRKGVTVHGLRASFKTWANEATRFPDYLSEMALAHSSADKVRSAYTRGRLIEMRRALMTAWEAHCMSGVGNTSTIRASQQQRIVAAAKIRARGKMLTSSEPSGEID